MERAVALHLCPQNAATWRNRPHLPSKACKLTAAIAAKAYSAVDQAASALHAPISQAGLLGDIAENCRAKPRNRQRRSCSGVMHRQPLLPPETGLRPLVAVGALLHPPDMLRPMLNRHLGWRDEPLAGVRRPPHPNRAPSCPGNRRSGPCAGNPEMLDFSLSQETARTASLLHQEGQVEYPMFHVISVPPLAQGPLVPTSHRKNIYFSSRFSGPRANSV